MLFQIESYVAGMIIYQYVLLFLPLKTTEYHWEQIDLKATNLLQDNSEDTRKYEIVSGPFGFKKAVKLDKNVAGGPQVTN